MAALWLNPELRGQRAGQRLVTFGLDMARAVNVDLGRAGGFCITDVKHGNDHALSLYQKLGFEITDGEKSIEKEGRTYHCTELKLKL
jgi:ribosomal protein S18 acetylase RimI-like enzyme